MEVSLGKPPGNRFPFPYTYHLIGGGGGDAFLSKYISIGYHLSHISRCSVLGVHRLNRKSMQLGRQRSTGCHVNVHGIRCRGVELI